MNPRLQSAINRIRSFFYRLRAWASNALKDFWDRYHNQICCAHLEEGDGGYTHWRCGRPRGHEGAHRFGNYIWPSPFGPQLRTIHIEDESLAAFRERLELTAVGLRYPDRDMTPNRAQRRARKRYTDAMVRRYHLRGGNLRPKKR